MPKLFSPLYSRRSKVFFGKSLGQTVFFLLIVLMVALAFWYNYKSQMTRIVEKELSRIDSTNTLSAEQEKTINEYQAAFLKEYGIRLIIKVSSSPDKDYAAPSSEQIQYIFIQIKPYASEVEFKLSPLVRIILSEELVEKLINEYLLTSFSNWPQVLAKTLNALTLYMDESMSKSVALPR